MNSLYTSSIQLFMGISVMVGWLGLIVYSILLVTRYRGKPNTALHFRGRWLSISGSLLLVSGFIKLFFFDGQSTGSGVLWTIVGSLTNLAGYQKLQRKKRTRGELRHNSTGKSPVSKLSQVSHLSPNLSEPSVRERDRIWVDTRDGRPSLRPEPKPSCNSNIEELIESLRCGNNSEFRRLAAELLGQMGSIATPAISALLIACVDVDASVREASLNALESIDPGWPQNPEVQKAFPKLTEKFKHSYCFSKSYSEDVSKASYKLLQQIGEPAVSSLANLIVEDEDKIDHKIHAIWLLKDIGSSAISTIPQLIQLLSNKASKVRIAAAEALVHFKSVAKVSIPVSIPTLIIGLSDRNQDVRKAMVACLLATEPAVPDLLPLLIDKNANVRESVADALIQIDPDALVIMPAIALALVGSNPDKKNVDDIKAMVACLNQYIIQQHSQSLSEGDLRDTTTANSTPQYSESVRTFGFEVKDVTTTANSVPPNSGYLYKQLVVEVCKILRQQIATPQDKSKVWPTYTKALSLARECDRDTLTQIIAEFDPLIKEQNLNDDDLAIEQTLSFLQKISFQNPQTLKAAWLLSKRLNQLSLRREVQQQICLQIARVGDSNLLINRLLESSLCLAEISQIIRDFFENHSPQTFAPWKAFLERFNLYELPQIHQVYAALERYEEASRLAEAVGDYSHAVCYLMTLSGREIAFRVLDLSERSGDRELTVKAHQKVAEIFWQEGNYRKALFHFQKAGNLEDARYCYEKLGESAQSSSSKAQQPFSQVEQVELNRHKQKLLRLLYGNYEQCKNLVNYERKKSPNKSEIELYEDAIFRLEKDRR
jgi:HEAT repeat protein/tetratricopeptide (TPR) repeat protein